MNDIAMLRRQLPAGGVILGMPFCLMRPEMVKAFRVSPLQVAESRARMEAADREGRPGAVLDRTERQPVKELRFYNNFQLAGLAARYDQLIYNADSRGNWQWYTYQEGCFGNIASDCPLQLGHDADAEPVCIGSDLTFRDDVDQMGAPVLAFYARSIMQSEAFDDAVRANWGNGGLRMELSISSVTVESHQETRYGKNVKVITGADLIHLALVPVGACKGTALYSYGRPF
jgi:hypothetical protein